MSSTSNTRRRKPRVVYSKDEVRYLKDYFLLCPNPDNKQQVAIATYLKKSKSEISTWFKNRRTYVKIKESREKPTTPDQIPPEIEVFNQENFLFQVNQPSNSINSYQQVLPTLNQVKTDFVVEKRARKARFTFTQQLKEALEEEYAKCSYPEHSKKKEIAERLQIDPEVVSYWYKNRRTKARKESGKENAAPSPPSWPTPPQTPPQPNTILEPHIYYEYQLYDQPSMSLEAPMEIQLRNPVSSFPPDSSSSNFSNVLNEIYQSMYQLFISFI